MIYINEWLPNPIGKDTEGEWVEIFNSGGETVNLTGWYLQAKSKTTFSLFGEIEPREFLVFQKPELKVSLNNTDGRVFLFDNQSRLIDSQEFLGLAPEGKSYGRTIDGEFFFLDPTPGVENKFLEGTGLISDNYLAGVVSSQHLGFGEVLALTLVSAAVLVGFLFFAIKKHESSSKLLFGRDEEIWR